ncbi:glycosyltransferase family 39 protein [Oscillochloris sp. ZM17-4]|uniref:glycosyltransferase family 39 protein n=1 Tax=Oscillochloris sp. ZM17-4 TaxID=2866714 RepID=UPI001C73BDDB|nr:glycosyltransferase family 39 protein [Oscillochloris sp. ZM17-4]MBX0328875.1 glycosyltransferase family 39 protein [Oscillochloris sp. ZM17-4]
MHSQTPARPALLGAALFALYAIATARLDEPHGMVNFWTWLGLALVVAAAVAAPLAAQRWSHQAQPWAYRHGVRLPLLVCAIGLGLLTSLRFYLFLRIGRDFAGATAALWLATIAALLAALVPSARPDPLAWLRAHRAELIGLGLLTLAGAALRLWELGALPRIINGDEGLIGTWAEDIGKASGILTMPFAAMDGVGTLYLATMQQVFALFGPTAFALRLLPAIAGTLAIPATYMFARQVAGQRVAIIAAALLTFSHVHIHFSRTVAVSYIYATLFVPLALYFLLSGLERRSALRLVLAVTMVGLHINTYVDGWVWLLLLPIMLVAWAVFDRSLFRGNGVPLAFFGLALALIITPMVIWGLSFPAEFYSRMTVDGTISSGWLANESQITGRPQIVILLDLLWQALGTFTHRPFIDFYGVGVPTLDPLAAGLWAIGLLIALWRTRERRILLLNGWFWAGVVALGPTTVPPSTYHYRLLVALPAAMVLAGLAADSLLTWARPLLGWLGWPGAAQQRRTGVALLTTALLVVAALNMRIYFGTFLPACRYETTQTRQAGLLGKYLHLHPSSVSAYVLTTPGSFRAGPFLSLDFLSGRMAVQNIDGPLADARPAELAGKFPQGLVVAAVPERADDLDRLSGWFPGGRYTVIQDCGEPALYLFEWRLPTVLSS